MAATGALGVSIPRRPPSDPCRASFSQERLWFLDQMEPGNPAYNVFRGVVLRGPLDVPALERTLAEIVRRHEVLRTTFSVVDGLLVQQIHDAKISLPMRDLSQRDNAKEIADREAERAFDLSADSLLRARLLRLAPEEHVLILTMHHIAVDGFSVALLFRELVTLYQAFSSGKESALSEPPVQFVDYAAWERQWLNQERLSKLLDYWKTQLAEMPVALMLPADRPRPAMQTSNGARYYFRIRRVQLEPLKSLGRQQNVTLFMTLLAAFQALLARYSGQEEFGAGSPMACREIEGVKELIGCFSNTLVLRANLTGNPSFNELLRRVRETVVGGISHQMMPFDKLVEALHPIRDPSRMALVQVNFRLLSTPLPAVAGDLKLEFLELDNRRSKFDLALELAENAGELSGYWEYSADLLEPESIACMASDYEDLLQAVAAAPDQPISELGFRPRFGRQREGQPSHSGRKPVYLRP